MSDFSRVVVTGGAGFIGSCLVRRLLTRGYSVVVLDNFYSGSIKNLKGLCGVGSLKVVKGDVRNKRGVRKVLRGCDAVVHLAALIDVEASVKNPYETHDVNVNGALNVLSEAVRTGVKRFVFASSTAVYGDANPLPLREDYPPRPISPYAASKAAAEAYCVAFNRCYGIETVILRYFNVYGPGQRNSAYSGVITKFLENAVNGKPLTIYGDGKQTRDFIYVEDVVNATVLALEKDGLSGEIFNICTGKPTSVNDLAKILGVIVGKDLEVVYDKPRKGDIENNFGYPFKAEKKLGFKAVTVLKHGLKSTIEAYHNSQL
ncbi:MAG: NAD-dependent epimerase/dehydratase family protein [Candidatus Bathyarchaeia archaeon]